MAEDPDEESKSINVSAVDARSAEWRVFSLQSQLISSGGGGEEAEAEELLLLHKSLQWLDEESYWAVVEERASGGQCGFPSCGGKVQVAAQRQQVCVDYKRKVVVDAGRLKLFCGSMCAQRNDVVVDKLSSQQRRRPDGQQEAGKQCEAGDIDALIRLLEHQPRIETRTTQRTEEEVVETGESIQFSMPPFRSAFLSDSGAVKSTVAVDTPETVHPVFGGVKKNSRGLLRLRVVEKNAAPLTALAPPANLPKPSPASDKAKPQTEGLIRVAPANAIRALSVNPFLSPAPFESQYRSNAEAFRKRAAGGAEPLWPPNSEDRHDHKPDGDSQNVDIEWEEDEEDEDEEIEEAAEEVSLFLRLWTAMDILFDRFSSSGGDSTVSATLEGTGRQHLSTGAEAVAVASRSLLDRGLSAAESVLGVLDLLGSAEERRSYHDARDELLSGVAAAERTQCPDLGAKEWKLLGLLIVDAAVRQQRLHLVPTEKEWEERVNICAGRILSTAKCANGLREGDLKALRLFFPSRQS